MASMDLASFLNYPDYLWVYFFHFYMLPNFNLISTIAIVTKNPPIFQFVKREMKNKFNF